MSQNLTYATGRGTGVGNQTLIESPWLCTLQTCDLSLASFRYLPTLPGNAIYSAIFGVLLIGQLWRGIQYKTWGYTTAMILGLVLEVIGYAARCMLHNSPFDNNDFLMYLITLTIAPAFMSASIYLCLSQIVMVYGAHLSRFHPRTYTIVFCSCDIISLILQAAGGGIAASANTSSMSNMGNNIMLAGLAYQVFSLLLFATFSFEFAIRVHKGRGAWRHEYLNLVNSAPFKTFLLGLAVATVTIFARSVYRCVELSGGFDGRLFVSEEGVFMVIEGVMLIIACSCLTFLHPAACFQGAWNEANFSLRSQEKSLHAKTKSGRVSDPELGTVSDSEGRARY